MTPTTAANYMRRMNPKWKSSSYSEIINKYVYEVDGYNIGKIELISNAADTKIYNNMICFSYNGN